MKNSQQTLESMSQAVWYNRWTLNKFKKYLKGDILEVGCGIGNFTKSLTSYGNVWAIDIDKSYTEATRKLTGDYVNVGFGDIEKGDYFFGKKAFNCVVCLNVLEHIKDDERAIANLSKLLKQDGILILLVPAHPKLYGAIDESIGHKRRYTKDKLARLIKSNKLNIIKTRRLNLLGALGWFISGKMFKNKSVNSLNIALFNLISPLLLLENIFEPPIGTSILFIAKR